MVRWVVGSILHGGPIELFLVPTSVIKAVIYTILSVAWCIKGPLLVIGKTGPDGAEVTLLANGLEGTWFASQYWLLSRVCF